MHYIRFLSPPRVQVDHGNVLLKAVLVITTDLGETFYPESIDLVATIRSPNPNGDIYLRRRVPYPAASRHVPVILNLTNQDVEWPACVHVSVKGNASHDSTNDGFLPPIVDIYSSPLNPTKGHMDSGPRVHRTFTALSNSRALTLHEETGDSIARHLWDGSQALASHLDNLLNLTGPASAPLPLLEYLLVSATYRRLHVLELGCGVGTVGLALAQSVPDIDVLLTDLEDVRELVEANIARMNAAMSSQVRFEPLDWHDAPNLPPQITARSMDLIVVSECTYNTSSLPALVATLVALAARSPKVLILVATKRRHESEVEFFHLMKEAGLIQDGATEVALPGLVGTGYSDSAGEVGLFCFRGKEHRLSLSPRGGSEEEVAKVGGGGLDGGGRGRARG